MRMCRVFGWSGVLLKLRVHCLAFGYLGKSISIASIRSLACIRLLSVLSSGMCVCGYVCYRFAFVQPIIRFWLRMMCVCLCACVYLYAEAVLMDRQFLCVQSTMFGSPSSMPLFSAVYSLLLYRHRSTAAILWGELCIMLIDVLHARSEFSANLRPFENAISEEMIEYVAAEWKKWSLYRWSEAKLSKFRPYASRVWN